MSQVRKFHESFEEIKETLRYSIKTEKKERETPLAPSYKLHI